MLELHRSTPATTTTALLCERNHVPVHTVEKIFIKQFIISQSKLKIQRKKKSQWNIYAIQ